MPMSKHQPQAGPVIRPKRDAGEYARVCAGTAVLVDAHDVCTTALRVCFEEKEKEPVTLEEAPRPLQVYDGHPLLWWALRAAVQAHPVAVRVLVHPSIREEAARIARDVEGEFCGGADVGADAGAGANAGADAAGLCIELVIYDEAAAYNAAREMAYFDICDLGFGTIDAARAMLSAHAGADCAVVIASDMPRVTCDHIYEVVADAADHSQAEIVCSWINWLRRPPFLFTRPFLEGLAASSLTGENERGMRPVPHIACRDHLFGEEALAANATVDANVAAFTGGVRLSALQAVGLARAHREDPDAPVCDPNAAQALIGPAAGTGLSAEDALLFECAEAVLERAETFEESLPAHERDELAFADAFGTRNRLDFPLLNDPAHKGRLSYLDTAATAQRLGAALDAQSDFDRHANANVYRGAYELSAKATFAFNDARAALERFIGAERRSVVYTANTTGACNLVASAWGEWNVGEGDAIVTTIAEHHSNMLPFLMLAERKGAHMVYVPVDGDGRIDRDAWRDALLQHPKLVCVAQVGNVFGMENPVAELAAEAREVGARVLVDAAQSFPHMKIDVSELGADFLALSAHKAYGPMGLGALWISAEAFAEMDPLAGGGGAVSHVSCESWYLRQKAVQYEDGTPPVSQAIGFAAAVEYLDALGMDNVERAARALTRLLDYGLSGIEGVTVWGDRSADDGLTGLLSFTLYGVAPAPLAQFLGACGVAIRSGGHCALPLHASMGLVGTGRASMGVYTTKDDILALLAAVEACRRVYRGLWHADEVHAGTDAGADAAAGVGETGRRHA